MRYQLRYVRVHRLRGDEAGHYRKSRSASKPAAPYRACMRDGYAYWRGWRYTGVSEVRRDWRIDADRYWFLASTFEGCRYAVAFERRDRGTLPSARWAGVPIDSWRSSLDRVQYMEAVESTRNLIAAGVVYQANICRVLSAPMPSTTSVLGLWHLIRTMHPAPYAGCIELPPTADLPDGISIVSASPELFLERRGDVLRTAPIKGTATSAETMLAKDRAENLMIVDLMRNDLARICVPGSVSVPRLFELEAHPGLVHLVSHVQGRLPPAAHAWDLIETLLPAGSVSGAPKSSAVRIIRELEGRDRGFYCGVLGVAHGEDADLAVGIRTFSRIGDRLEFGVGAGITWGSDPSGEWFETELKATRLLAVAADSWGVS